MRTPHPGPAPAVLALCVCVVALAASAPGLAQCTLNSDCPPEDYCAKADGDCLGVGNCEPRPPICPPLWDPVCGCDGLTHGNDCSAAADGVNVDYRGECVQQSCWSNVDCAAEEYCFFPDCAIETGECRPRPLECPDVWEPVCDCNGDSHQSACHAAFDGQSVDSPGACPDDVCGDNSECIPEEYCAKADGDCDGEGACLARPTDCPFLWDPVCGCDGLTYANECIAAWEGVNVEFPGECDAVCLANDDCPPEEYCQKALGDCEAGGICSPRPPDCPAVWDPVCGCDGVTYGNECFAAMAGASVFGSGGCIHACRGSVPALVSGWRAAALPLTLDNDDETPPFPVLTVIPGEVGDEIVSSAQLVLYRVVQDVDPTALNTLRAVKGAAGVELGW